MGEKRNDGAEKVEDVMLPGFRFHPTDEELVGFYLKKKIQGRTLPMELIKQVDIYKYDPWDLPKYGRSGEKEWYYYCARDRKYRNSARPNRVTSGGFWKATGTDRPIYSSSSSSSGSIIGLKKSLVFYRGRAAKGMKTEWMMHEFRLPPIPHHSSNNNKLLHNSIPPNDCWAICRIFKKTTSMGQIRALSHFQDNLLITRGCTSGRENNGLMMFDNSTTETLITSSLHPLGDAIDFAGSHHFNGFSIVSPPGIIGMEEEAGSNKNPPIGVHIGSQWPDSVAFPFSLPWEEDSSPTHHLFQPTTPLLLS